MFDFDNQFTTGASLVVGVVCQQQWHWYVSERVFWYLDFVKLHEYEKITGMSDAGDEDIAAGRFLITVVDRNTASHFLDKMESYKVKTSDLEECLAFFYSCDDEDEFFDILEYLAPVLKVDFDTQTLTGYHPEYGRLPFQKFIPDGWIGTSGGFLETVPIAERFWVLEGLDMLEIADSRPWIEY